MTICTIDVHSRDVVSKLILSKVKYFFWYLQESLGFVVMVSKNSPFIKKTGIIRFYFAGELWQLVHVEVPASSQLGLGEPRLLGQHL